MIVERGGHELYDLLDEHEQVMFELVRIGWTLFEKRLPGADYLARGGLVVDVETDEDGKRVFTLVHSPAGRVTFFQLKQDDVDIYDAQMVDQSKVRARARQMQEQASRNHGAADGFELKLTRYALALLEEIA